MKLLLDRLEKAFKKIGKADRDSEITNLNEVIDKVDTAHPNWNLSEYKINLQ